MRAALISETFLKKADKIKNLIMFLGMIQTKISEKKVLSDLRRRVKQEGNQDPLARNPGELPRCICYNNSKLLRDTATILPSN